MPDMDASPDTRLSITAAAKAAGVARSTIQRAIKTGRLPHNPDKTIDVAELHRVYPINEALLEQRVSELERERDTLQQRLYDEKAEKLRLLSMVESLQQLLEASQQQQRQGLRDRLRRMWPGRVR